MSKKIYSFAHDDAPASSFPLWLNKPKSSDPDWEDQLPPGHLPDTGNHANGLGSGFPNGMPTPILQWTGDEADVPDFLLLDRTIWLLSDHAKEVIESIDADAFEFRECVTLFSHGAKGAKRWLADIVRFLDAVDEDKSDVYVQTVASWRTGEPIKRVSHGIRGRDVFKASVVDDYHVFRAFYAPATTFFDESFVAAVAAAKLRGITPFLAGVTDG